LTLNDEATTRGFPWPSLAVEANLSEILEEIQDFQDTNGVLLLPSVGSLPAAGHRGNVYQVTSTGLFYIDDGATMRGPFGMISSTLGDITDSAPGDTAAVGGTGRAADAGHKHGREGSATSLDGSANLTTWTEKLVDLGTIGSSFNVDLSQANAFKGVLGANTTMSIINVPSTSNVRIMISLRLKQDGTGGRTVTWPASFDWGLAGAPPLSAANKGDLITFTSDDNGTTWIAFYGAAGGF
jgi:hypothetical protein